MMTFKRIFSKILDYTWFASLLLFALESAEANLWISLSTILLVPLLFAPIEALFCKLFGSTLGKIVFGLRYAKPLSWKSAFSLSFQRALLLQPLFLPGVNFLFAFLYLKEWKRYGKARWNPPGAPPIIRKFPHFIPYTLLLSTAIVISFLSFAKEWTVEELYHIAKIEKPTFFQKHDSPENAAEETWVKISPESLSFSILFPKAPAFVELKRPVPKSTILLLYQEYAHKDSIDYILGYTELPKSWTKWGSNLVFKGALHILYGENSQVHRKKKTNHGPFPALEYEITQKGQRITGKLVLVGNTLYKVEIAQTKELSKEDRESAEKFFASFTPRSL